MKTQLRNLVANALYPTKAYNLPSVCERYGLEPGDSDEAFSSKTQYVMTRLEKLSEDHVFKIAKSVVKDFPDDNLLAAVEQIEKPGRLVSDLTRHHLAEALDDLSLGGKRDLLEMLRKHWPAIDHMASEHDPFARLADDIDRHVVQNNDWWNSTVLERLGFMTCSQAKLFQFLEDVLHPIRRDQDDQEKIVAKLNPILQRDGYCLTAADRVSGYPKYTVRETTLAGSQPADELISQVLVSFDESGVHHAWEKALARRISDPEGAITAARTLLETVCKHIIDEAGETYGQHDDLPKLYNTAAECLNLAPSQHSEKVFRSILGNCQSIVNNLAGLRNKLGDSHGQGKRHVKPRARHAELAVNLAGSVAMFLVSTWNARKG
ncbi:MAG: abortive infection family protein [Acidobacteria bacterium]|nr:abortive infection family protein [Acidobacteriota bacterium]